MAFPVSSQDIVFCRGLGQAFRACCEGGDWGQWEERVQLRFLAACGERPIAWVDARQYVRLGWNRGAGVA